MSHPNFEYDWANRAPADMHYTPGVMSRSYKQYGADLPWYPGKLLQQSTKQATGTISGAFDRLANTMMIGMLLFFGMIAGLVILVFAGIITVNVLKK